MPAPVARSNGTDAGPARKTTAALLRHALQGGILGAVALAGVLIFTSGIETLSALATFPSIWLPALALLVVLSWTCNAGRTWFLCRALGCPQPFRTVFPITVSMEFGVAATPGGVGGSALLVALLRGRGVPVTAGISLLAVDVAIDAALFLLLIPPATLVLVTDPSWLDFLESTHIRLGKPLLAIGIWLGIVALAIATRRWWGPCIHALGASSTGKRHRVAARLRLLRRRWRDGLVTSATTTARMFREQKTALFVTLLLAIGQWTCRYAILPLLLFLFGVRCNPIPLFAAQGALLLISVAVLAPGGGGAVEVLSSLVLPGLLPASEAGAVLLLWRCATYHFYLLAGGAICLLYLRASPGKGQGPTKQNSSAIKTRG